VIEQIGEDNNIGMFAQPVKAFDRAINRLLAVHLGIEKAVEQVPHLTALDNGAIMLVAQRLAPIAVDEVKMDMMRVVQPIAEGHDHV
jgi:hypothetical protein